VSESRPPVGASEIPFTALSRSHPEAVAALTGKDPGDVQGPSTIYAAVAAFRRRLDRGEANAIPFGLSRIDRATRGAEPGELTACLGRTASLKTMFMINHIRHVITSRPSLAVLLVGIEMPREQLVRRLLRMEYNRTDDLLKNAVDAGLINFERFCEKYQHLYFVDQGGISLSTIKRYAQDLQRSWPPSTVGRLTTESAPWDQTPTAGHWRFRRNSRWSPAGASGWPC
jgi:hypothetical protein